MNSVDARSRGINNGDIVKLFNDRGACLAGVNINENIRPELYKLAQALGMIRRILNSKPSANMVILMSYKDKGTSKLGQGPIAHSCLIEVELVTDNVSPVTAFDPPVIIRDNKYNSNKYVDK